MSSFENLKTFEKNLLAAFPPENWRNWRVCVAVSGGADSVALLCGLTRIVESAKNSETRRAADALFVATVDHRSRGAESDGDVAFVRELSASLGLKCVELTVDVDELEREARRRGSWEDAARAIRYRLLTDAARRGGARFLATAHHRDDQLETLLFRLFRGSGFDGLRATPTARPLDDATILARPLLGVGREEILEYLREIGRSFRVDSSNASPKFSRNRIRNELVPLLESIFPGRWKNSLERLSRLADETESFFEEALKPLESEIETARRRDASFRRTLEAFNVSESVLRTFLDDGAATETGCSDAILLPREPLRSASELVVCRYFRKIWKSRGWPLGAMGSDEWRRLAEAARLEPSERVEKAPSVFPGDVFLTFPDEKTLRLERRRRCV